MGCVSPKPVVERSTEEPDTPLGKAEQHQDHQDHQAQEQEETQEEQRRRDEDQRRAERQAREEEAARQQKEEERRQREQEARRREVEEQRRLEEELEVERAAQQVAEEEASRREEFESSAVEDEPSAQTELQALPTSISGRRERTRAVVLSVKDPVSFYIKVGIQKVTVRMRHIDPPPPGGTYYQRARAELGRLIGSKTVALDTWIKRDDVWFADVHVGGTHDPMQTWVQAELLKKGLATLQPGIERRGLIELQRGAVRDGVGMWHTVEAEVEQPPTPEKRTRTKALVLAVKGPCAFTVRMGITTVVVRLRCVDPPPLGPIYSNAKAELGRLTTSKTVRLDTWYKEGDTWFSDVHVGSTWVQAELLKQGLCRLQSGVEQRGLIECENAARKKGYGLWAGVSLKPRKASPRRRTPRRKRP